MIKKLIILSILIGSLYAKGEFLYPVYSKKLDTIGIYHKRILFEGTIVKVKYIRTPCHYLSPSRAFGRVSMRINLNNILIFQDDYYNLQEKIIYKKWRMGDKIKCNTDDRFRYTLLGKIIINDNNKLEYNFFDFKDKYIKNKIFKLKKNISYINDNNFPIKKIKKILDADLINQELGEQLYKNKQLKIPTKKATNNFINCRFCEQVINSIELHDNYYEILFDRNYRYSTVLFNNKKITDTKAMIKLLKDIEKKGNIFKQLNRKYISETYEEWKKIVAKENNQTTK